MNTNEDINLNNFDSILNESIENEGLEAEIIKPQEFESNDNIGLVNKQDVCLSYKISDFEDDKEMDRFVKKVKSIIRNTPEYKYWVEYVKHTLNYNYCILSKESLNEVTLDVHHHPVTLETMVQATIISKMNKGQSFCSIEIAEEVLKLHFENKVGYCVLLASLHEKYHNGYLKISIDDIQGNWRLFIQEFKDFITKNELDFITELASINKSDNYIIKKD